MEIAENAGKHGVADDDIRHAVQVAFRVVPHGDARTLFIGADRAGRLLEVVVENDDDRPIAIHAMPLRQKFYRYL